MRVLVTGSSGLLGLNLALLAGSSHTVFGVDRSSLAKVPFKLIQAELLEPGAVQRVLDESRPEAVIHCAALADLDACEADPQLAQRLNAQLPGELAAACSRRGVRLAHLSTDAVFDGTKSGVYTEEDAPNPVGVYARTKLEGEQRVLDADPGAIVVRVNFYGFSLGGTRSLAEFFLNNLEARKRVNGFTDVQFCPTFVGDLAGTLLAMLEQGLSGLYHAVGAQAMSKYDFGRALAHRFGYDQGLIQPVSVEEAGLAVRRSHNLRLSIHRLTTALDQPVHNFSAGLDAFYTQYQQGYPQKLRSYQQAGD